MNYVAVCDGGVEPTNNKLFGDNWTTISHCGRVEWKNIRRKLEVSHRIHGAGIYANMTGVY